METQLASSASALVIPIEQIEMYAHHHPMNPVATATRGTLKGNLPGPMELVADNVKVDCRLLEGAEYLITYRENDRIREIEGKLVTPIASRARFVLA